MFVQCAQAELILFRGKAFEMRLGNPNDLHGLFRRCSVVAVLVACVTHSSISRGADAPVPLPPEKPTDFANQNTVYVVGYAHLDTQWRWSYPQVVNFFLANTLHDNPPLMDKYPHYIFNFTGARRYQLMKEFFPADYERMKGYIKAGRWFPGGSSVDECDQNTPSAESVVRQVLYGNHFLKKEFGVCGADFMVPDCFGFPYSLPTILSHCSIKGFNTQKLEWGAASDWWKDHPVGLWQGVDGETVITAFHPTGYGSKIPNDVLNNPDWLKRVADAGKETGVHVDYRYYGTGDRGGAPAESSIANMEKAVTGTGPFRVISATSDQMFRDITPDERAKLPVYNGDLLLTWHSAGSINSQGFMKRCNRKNELLGDAAERASVAAYSLGDAPYPTDKLYRSWMLMLECQMHDILPGDCLPVCYEYSWNDEILASNGFAAAEQDGVGAVASEMDTRAAGAPLVVYNPLSSDREDPVEATVAFPTDAPDAVTVTGPDGASCPVQIIGHDGQNKLKILFLARVPGDSFSTFDVQPTAKPATTSVVSHSDCALSRAFLARSTFSRIFSTLAVQTNGVGRSLWP
jgi:alpha-mannosidase